MARWHRAWWEKDHLGASSSSQARWCMGKPCLLSLYAEAGAVSVLFFPIWFLLPQFCGGWDAWHSPAQLLLEVLATRAQMKCVPQEGASGRIWPF